MSWAGTDVKRESREAVRIRTERVYAFEGREKAPGIQAVLVDRLWPRGLSKADLPFNE